MTTYVGMLKRYRERVTKTSRYALHVSIAGCDRVSPCTRSIWYIITCRVYKNHRRRAARTTAARSFSTFDLKRVGRIHRRADSHAHLGRYGKYMALRRLKKDFFPWKPLPRIGRVFSDHIFPLDLPRKPVKTRYSRSDHEPIDSTASTRVWNLRNPTGPAVSRVDFQFRLSYDR